MWLLKDIFLLADACKVNVALLMTFDNYSEATQNVELNNKIKSSLCSQYYSKACNE